MLEISLDRATLPSLVLAALLLPAPFVVAAEDPLPEPDPERGTIGVTFLSGLVAGETATKVFFVRLDDDDGDYLEPSVIESDFAGGKQVYLLNAEPGRYVAVGAVMAGYDPGVWAGEIYVAGRGHYTFTVFFSKEVIARTEVTVGPGELVFMGKFVGKKVTHKRKKPPDETQELYSSLVCGGPETRPRKILGLRLKHVRREPEFERAFWIKARDKVFKDRPRWRERMERELRPTKDSGPDAASTETEQEDMTWTWSDE